MRYFSKRSFNRIKILCSILVMVIAFGMVPGMNVEADYLFEIDHTTFRGNPGISSIHIGSEVVDISTTAFKGLNNLQSITVSADNPFFASYSNCLYNKDLTELICFPAALKGAIIPDTVVSVRTNALYGVDANIRKQINGLIQSQATENMMEWEVTGPHFIHTDYGI